MEREALEEAIRKAGGQAALAARIGVHQTLVSYWLNKRNGRVTRGEHALAIEREFGVSRSRLAPHVYPLGGQGSIPARGAA